LEIYLDNAATTKPLINLSVQRYLSDMWYNPSSSYNQAESVFSEIKQIRKKLMSKVGLTGGCVFTSGGTEANNLAVMSCFRKGAHYVTSTVEHPSVYETFRRIEQMGAFVSYVKPRGFCVCPEDVAAQVTDETALVSVMHVNNETGALNDITAIGKAVKARNPAALFHSDGVQALLKTQMDTHSGMIDYYSVSAHKIHALKGTGALLMRNSKGIKPLLTGGGQEMLLRAGTENTLGIMAFGEALESAQTLFSEAEAKIPLLREMLIGGIQEIEDASINVPESFVPHIVSVSFAGVRGEVVARLMGEKGICIGTGAACSRGKLSRVLLECGVGRPLAEGTVRVSFSHQNTAHDVEACLQELINTVAHLRRFSRK
jgi:cysteine desulfurase